MSQHPDLSSNPHYYAARAVEERRLAMAATDENARAIHLELAVEYERLAGSGEAPPPIMDGERNTA